MGNNVGDSGETGGAGKMSEKGAIRKISHTVSLLKVYAVDSTSGTRFNEIERCLGAIAEIHCGTASWSEEDAYVVIPLFVGGGQLLDQGLEVALDVGRRVRFEHFFVFMNEEKDDRVNFRKKRVNLMKVRLRDGRNHFVVI